MFKRNEHLFYFVCKEALTDIMTINLNLVLQINVIREGNIFCITYKKSDSMKPKRGISTVRVFFFYHVVIFMNEC